jgi:hypothetical protein
MGFAEDIGMQPAKIRHTRGRAHAAEKAVTLDQQRAAARARGSDGGGNTSRPAAENRDFIFAVERDLTRRFGDGFERQIQIPLRL